MAKRSAESNPKPKRGNRAGTLEISQIDSVARRHLARRDPVLKRLIRLVGPCTLQHNPNCFAVLIRSIISQQISSKAAAAIAGRVQQTLAPAGFVPEAILARSIEDLRAAGLSASKVRSILDLAERVQNQTLPLDHLHQLPDEEVIAHLVPVRGIGRWTAEMFLIFSLGRLDVLPVGDWGLRAAVQREYGLEEPPNKARLEELAEPWRPYRSIATWYFWRSLGPVPQSQ
ncbi:MAG TPA: DNA-3-methyladenine glycosylase 2 family protein [Gemmataceae bacterium]|nr:DNA-3-methyladenine glycosylase 2 family protein [Gemmataceae bacterium]